jgi:hypothetical protein
MNQRVAAQTVCFLAQPSTLRSRHGTSPTGSLPFSCPLSARDVYRVNAVLLRPASSSHPRAESSCPRTASVSETANRYLSFSQIQSRGPRAARNPFRAESNCSRAVGLAARWIRAAARAFVWNPELLLPRGVAVCETVGSSFRTVRTVNRSYRPMVSSPPAGGCYLALQNPVMCFDSHSTMTSE